MARSCRRFTPATRHLGAAIAALLVWSACTRDQTNLTAPRGQLPSQNLISPAASSSVRIPGHYIVVLKDDVQDVDGVANTVAAKHAGKLRYVYKAALKGFAVQLSDAAASALRSDPAVAYVEQDGEVHAVTGQPNTTWGLQRISQHPSLPAGSDPFSYTYTYTYFADGTGVTEYTIDTGIDIANADFEGRARVGFDALGGTGIDCNGHGTHVSGTIGGRMWGIAKKVQLVAVRVLDCSGSGTVSGVIAGINWVTANRTAPAVANMSLGGGFSASLNQAVENSIAAGVIYAIAAGNSAADACGFSPASAPHAITVGATDIGDNFAYFSNFGSCVKINAPGVDVTSDWLSGGTNTISGTSMATPHVAGTAALYLSAHRTATPAQVQTALTSNATAGLIVGLPASTPNLIDYSAFIGSGPPPTTFTLTITGAGSGTGTITSSPAGINCTSAGGATSGTCSATYASGAVVTLTASAASGSSFTSWSGACTGTAATCSVTMNANKTATATFAGSATTYALALTGAGSGTGTVTSSPAGINCTSTAGVTSGACNATYTSGAVVTLTASAAGGSSFTNWSGACAGTTATCSVTMNAAKSVTANFASSGDEQGQH